MTRFLYSIMLTCFLAVHYGTCAENQDKDATKTFSLKKNKKPQKSIEDSLTGNAHPKEKKGTGATNKIYLNFDNASLASVLNYLVEQKNLDVLPHKDLAAVKVTLMSREPITIDEAWETMLLLMETNNFTIVNINGVHRVIPLTANQQSALPFYSSLKTEPEDLPDTNTQCRYAYFCKNLTLSVAQGIIAPLVSDKALQTNTTLQACIITDNCNVIKSALRLIKELDVGGMRQSIKILQLRHADSDTLAKLFSEQILQQQPQDNKIRIIAEEKRRDLSYFSKDTKILSDPTHNRLIFMGMEDSIQKIIEFTNKYLDVPIGKADSRLHIKELQYYDAGTMKSLLDQMIVPPKGLGGTAGTVEGEYKFFEDVVVTADTGNANGGHAGGNSSGGSGNRLIIACNNEDWRRLTQFIDTIDKPQPQVALEIMIVDINTDDTRGLGGQVLPKPGLLGPNINAAGFTLPLGSPGGISSNPQYEIATGSNNTAPWATNVLNSLGSGTAAGSTAIDPGSTILSFGNAASNQIWGAIRAMYDINHQNVISQPYLIVNNNVKATENLTVTRLVKSLQNNNSGQAIQTLSPTPASIITEITPHVNGTGLVKLEIHITVNEFAETDSTSPNTTNREIMMQASMCTGEVLVIGGLTSAANSDNTWAVPFFSALPIIGTFFRNKTRGAQKSNLYIFVRPTIVKPHFMAGNDEYTQLKLDYAKYQILNADDTALSKDPIQRYFFAPTDRTIKQVTSDFKNGRMPVIDDFAQRRTLPSEVHMSKDPLFKPIAEESSLDYEPEESFVSMPHMKPDEYVTPGLFEDLINDDIFKEFADHEAQQQAPLAERSTRL